MRRGVVESEAWRRSKEGLLLLWLDEKEFELGRLQLIPLLPSSNKDDDGGLSCSGRCRLVLGPASAPPNKPSTSLVISSRSSTHAARLSQVFFMRDDRLIACASSVLSPRESDARTVFRLVWVDIED